jgi:hypothetical protein
MIAPDDTVFPNNIITMIHAAIPIAIDPDVTIVLRPLRPTDPNQSIGIYADTWSPDEDSFEMSGPVMANTPTLQDYRVFVQSFIKHADEPTALNIHCVVAKRIRTMLYAEPLLQVAFAQLIHTSSGRTEKSYRWGPRAQRFISNEVQGSFLQSSITEFWLQTATQ